MWKTSRQLAPADIPRGLWSLYQHSSRKGRSLVAIAWDKKDCSQCPLRQQCLPPRQVQRVLRLSPYYTLLTTRRAEQKTPAFRERYRRRAGIEATFSHLVNVHRVPANAVLRLREDALLLCGSCGGGEFAPCGAVGGWTSSSAKAVYVSFPRVGEPEPAEGAGKSPLKFQAVLDFSH